MRILFFCAVGLSIALLVRAHMRSRASASGSAMSVDEAAALLGIHTMSTADEIRAAHRRAIKEAHPDTGGDAADAARINLARDMLLAYHRRYES